MLKISVFTSEAGLLSNADSKLAAALNANVLEGVQFISKDGGNVSLCVSFKYVLLSVGRGRYETAIVLSLFNSAIQREWSCSTNDSERYDKYRSDDWTKTDHTLLLTDAVGDIDAGVLRGMIDEWRAAFE